MQLHILLTYYPFLLFSCKSFTIRISIITLKATCISFYIFRTTKAQCKVLLAILSGDNAILSNSLTALLQADRIRARTWPNKNKHKKRQFLVMLHGIAPHCSNALVVTEKLLNWSTFVSNIRSPML